jgi:hypothetical protein
VGGNTAKALLARIDLCRRCEEPKAIPDFDNVSVANLSVRASWHNLEEIAVRSDRRRWEPPQLGARHLRRRNCVVCAVDLDLEAWRHVAFVGRIWFIRHLQPPMWYHDTTASRYLTTTVSATIILSMKPVKAMTIRLSAEQAEELATVADVEAKPVSEVIRAAIAQHIKSRKSDPTFRDSLKDRLNRAKKLLG